MKKRIDDRVTQSAQKINHFVFSICQSLVGNRINIVLGFVHDCNLVRSDAMDKSSSDYDFR